MQPIKRVKNYFTESVLYQETNKVTKESLPNDIDRGNEVDSKSKDNTPTTVAMEPLVAYLDDSYYNTTEK